MRKGSSNPPYAAAVPECLRIGPHRFVTLLAYMWGNTAHDDAVESKALKHSEMMEVIGECLGVDIRCLEALSNPVLCPGSAARRQLPGSLERYQLDTVAIPSVSQPVQPRCMRCLLS